MFPLMCTNIGIIASLAFQRSYSPLLAAGSLTAATPSAPNIALLTPDTRGQAFAFCSAADVRAGASQLVFDPVRPHLLYGSFRRHDGVYAWDLRGDTSVPVRVMRTGDTGTNQRIRFGIDVAGRWLGLGDQVGPPSEKQMSVHIRTDRSYLGIRPLREGSACCGRYNWRLHF
jgi:telomerase Cajal body protein 1